MHDSGKCSDLQQMSSRKSFWENKKPCLIFLHRQSNYYTTNQFRILAVTKEPPVVDTKSASTLVTISVRTYDKKLNLNHITTCAFGAVV